jgi:hypothetical protein
MNPVSPNREKVPAMTIYGLGTSAGKFKLFMSRISVDYEKTRQFLGSAVFRDLSIHPNRDRGGKSRSYYR